MEDAKKNYSSFASTSASSSMSSERTEQEALRVDSETSTVEVAEENEADDSSLRSVAIASPAFDKLHGSMLDVPRKASFSLGQENFADRDSTNTPTVSSTSGDTCYYNSTTMERPPNIAHYRLTSLMRSTGVMGSKRLTQTELNDRQRASQDSSSIVLAMDSTLETFNAPKAEPGAHRKRSRDPEAANEEEIKKAMHYFEGVFVPSFTNICGTLLYLRMGYVAGQAGILGGIGIVLFSTFVVALTAISCSAICSNGKQLKAGVYYIVSRSLGPQFGGVIGVIFSLANVGMAALYIVGIAEFISDLLTERGYDHFTLSRQDDIRIYSLVVCLILMWVFIYKILDILSK
ncbi:amino acid permease domain-containing protein [Ditylenchus destructor]|uniref:Amino acid permease domain-containing protein n=1 Tax=Ditylenchus destructor TaxID=166010 RepID=A0AAD4N0Q4_9BILA|nr:amino acid permease domain-containing protein [Ditylenchus destructor]